MINSLIYLFPTVFLYCLRFKRSRIRTSSGSDARSYSVPSTWSPIDPSEEFKFVDLSEVLNHDEYSKVKAQFLTTMTGFRVTSIKRVQNPGLWEDYERYVLIIVCYLLCYLRNRKHFPCLHRVYIDADSIYCCAH
jgi:hypothetical protein